MTKMDRIKRSAEHTDPHGVQPAVAGPHASSTPLAPG
jgi:hypothetical protein